MMIRKRVFLFLTFATAAWSQGEELPAEFRVEERFLSLSSTFDLYTEKESFALARKRLFSLTTAFDLEDRHQQPWASASARFFSWGTVADVADPAGNKIGWIEEEILRILPWAKYKVFNSENRLVAIAEMNFWGTCFELHHPEQDQEVYATIERPFFRCYRDNWAVRIKNPSVFERGIIDPRLLVILAIYQSDKDTRDAYRNQAAAQILLDQNY